MICTFVLLHKYILNKRRCQDISCKNLCLPLFLFIMKKVRLTCFYIIRMDFRCCDILRLVWFCLPVSLFCTWGCVSGDMPDEPEEHETSSEDVPDGYLFFRDDSTGHLKYIAFMGKFTDPGFSLLDSAAVDMDLGLDCYHPEVSPDGKWVAFSTGYESSGGASSLYVKRIGNSAPPQKLNVVNAAIPRWRVLPDGDTVIVYVDDTRVLPSRNTEEDSLIRIHFLQWTDRGTWIVPFKGGSFGKSRKIADGTFNGGVSEDLTYMVSGSALLLGRHVVYGEGGGVEKEETSIWFDWEQVCNTSLSRDGTNRTLFLDMSGKQGVDFSGETYRPHQRILVVDESGTLVHSVPSPAGTAFNNTEWIGVDDYVIADLIETESFNSSIVLVNMRDSSIVDLVRGGKMGYPNLWVNPAYRQP